MAEDRDENRDEDRGFTVSDRRRFSPETGEARRDEEGRREEDEKQNQSEGEQPQREAVSAAESQERSPKESARPGARSGSSAETAPLPEITLPTFIMSMSTQVLMLMGEIPDPTGRKLERDMTSAKQVIDILGMLREKTKGNLEKAEETLLDNVLYDLRIRYVELTKAGAKD